MGRRGPNLKARNVSVLFSDSTHTLHLYEVKVRVRQVFNDEGPQEVRVDRKEAEEAARARIAARGKNPDLYDLVGILAVAEDALTQHIVWATEVETAEAVEV